MAAAETIATVGAILALIKEMVDWVKKKIEEGRLDVEELRKNPLEYFVAKYTEAIKAQAEAEAHLPN